MKKLLPIILMLPILFATLTLKAQKKSLWTGTSVENSERLIPVKKHKDFNLNIDEITSYLKKSKETELSIPYPDGNFKSFNLKESQIMEPALAAKFPNIKAYVGRNPETGDNIRISIGKDGFHAMVFSKKGVFFIDPISKKDNINYQVYYKKDLNADLIKREFYEEEPIIADKQKFAEVKRKVESGLVERPSGTELRTYRIAIATTGEYTQFHGGTVEGALSAIVTTMNRVNGIYERDIAVTMVIVENNDQLIYTDSGTDPFTNNSAGAFISEVQSNITSIIGSDNFDIGHGFSTGAGGLASLGSVCINSRKASGVTGLPQPIGDPYDVDYVAHEIGHQFGAPHTFNGVVGSCAGGNRSGNSAYEPGSGSTIMAYAGICGSDNIQNNSDPYFHAASLDFMTVFSQDNGGNSCAEITETGNSLPVVEAGESGFTIPINTPFQLNGSATDPDGDGLTYTWEQFDLGPAGNPNTPVDNAPLFRSFAPTTDSFRIFPQLSDILDGEQTQGEILPFYTRDMSFRLTVRDDQGVAGVDYDDVSMSVTEEAGPFIVEEFTGEYVGFSTATVNWEVNNTDLAPVNAEFVDIYLSTDGGNTFTEKVLENTPNDGSQVVTMPNVNTSTAKFKVSASNNVFFNISPGIFSVSETTDPTFTISVNSDLVDYCPSDDVTFTIDTESILEYDEAIDLSIESISGLSESFENISIAPGESTTLTLTNDGQTSGNITLTLTANSGSISKSVDVPFTITNDPVAPVIITPTDGATDLSLKPSFSWDDANIESTYNVEIASDSEFTNIIESGSTPDKIYTVQDDLQGSTTYFARVFTENNCGLSGFDEISFTTAAINCGEITASNVPVSIASSDPNTVTSTLLIDASGDIENLEVTNVTGTHTYISDLVFTLVSPTGTEVVLLSNICGNEDNFSFSFSDDAENSDFPCPPTDGGVYQPETSLNAFAGEEIQGEWTLIIQDEFAQDGGELQSWGLDICTRNYTEPAILSPTSLTAEENDQTEILLEWTDNSDNETGFILEKSIGNNLGFEQLTVLDPNATSYLDTSLEAETIYFYRVKAFNNDDESIYSNEVEIETQANFPEAPTNLAVSNPSNFNARLTWVDNATNEDAYLIERATETGGFEQIAQLDPNIEEFEETLEPGNYSYRVLATNSRGDSDYSNEVTIEILINLPAGPTNLEINVVDDYSAQLTWIDNATNEEVYIVERATGSGSFDKIVTLPANTEFYQEDLEFDNYTYRIAARNSRGDSDYSNEVSVGTDVLSVNEELINKIILFPNPAKESVYLRNESGIKINKIQIRNALGQLIEQEIAIDNIQQIEIPVQNLSKGMYLIQINSNEGNIVKQIIIE